ncbi:hypothetical protein TNIN_299451 [Trichonephila inaurata madagascariensis]|uniref:Uncharacterized protein n=1 Tax=Trichonephila inaurata madagascariensis TaxID=2747483 RepID=A0A8X6XNL8_9ARAC|nr:hypothetical protein TNIN_299451 [Trichonephila inaurata madagascariensis]
MSEHPTMNYNEQFGTHCNLFHKNYAKLAFCISITFQNDHRYTACYLCKSILRGRTNFPNWIKVIYKKKR